MIDRKTASRLTPSEKSMILSLEEQCRQYEQLELSAPDLDDPEAEILMYFEEPRGNLVSVLIAYDIGEALEVKAYTHPEKRSRGYFSALFETLLNEHEEVPVCFYTDGCSYDALSVLESIDAEYEGTEHILQLKNADDNDLSGPAVPEVEIRTAGSSLFPALSRMHARAFDVEEEDSLSFLEAASVQGDLIQAFFIHTGGQPECCGFAILSTADDGSAASGTSLYGFTVDTEHQGQGIGTAALQALLMMPNLSFPVTLQVTEENEAAWKLYRHAGFESVSELMEYWY